MSCCTEIHHISVKIEKSICRCCCILFRCHRPKICNTIKETHSNSCFVFFLVFKKKSFERIADGFTTVSIHRTEYTRVGVGEQLNLQNMMRVIRFTHTDTHIHISAMSMMPSLLEPNRMVEKEHRFQMAQIVINVQQKSNPQRVGRIVMLRWS